MTRFRVGAGRTDSADADAGGVDAEIVRVLEDPLGGLDRVLEPGRVRVLRGQPDLYAGHHDVGCGCDECPNV